MAGSPQELGPSQPVLRCLRHHPHALADAALMLSRFAKSAK